MVEKSAVSAAADSPPATFRRAHCCKGCPLTLPIVVSDKRISGSSNAGLTAKLSSPPIAFPRSQMTDPGPAWKEGFKLPAPVKSSSTGYVVSHQ